MKIATLISQLEYTPEQKAQIEEFGEFEIHNVKKIAGDEIVKRIKDVDALIVGSSGVETIDANVLEQCPNLKFISVMGVGTDFIDLDKATELGIKVSNLRGVNSESVAEHTWGLILDLAKKITEAHNGTKSGAYEFKHYLGTEIYGKTIGIIGYGEIGQRIARIAKGFDMKVLSHTRTPKDVKEIEFVELNELLKQSDIIVLSIPVTEETKGIIDKNALSKMKDNIILVNPAREELVIEEDLLQALDSGRMYGFGFEADINTQPNTKFYDYPNVVITPHNAFFTKESEKEASRVVIENLVKFLEGNPQNIVN